MEQKRASESCTEQVQILFSADMNGAKRLFGGKLMAWIDVVAAVTARRHSGRNVTTAYVDSLQFLGAAYANDTLVLRGCVTYTGTTSMEVKVETYVEELDGSKRMVNTAYVVLVALDENEKPTPVPPLLVETEEEQQQWKEAKKRYADRKQLRKQ